MLNIIFKGKFWGDIGLAARDLKSALYDYPWIYLSWQEVRQRYRRSVLGPLWITISMGILIAAMGPLYALLFDQKTSFYTKYFSISFIVWSFFASYLNDVCVSLSSSGAFIKQMKLPYSLYIIKALTKCFIIFLHNSLIIFVILLLFPEINGYIYLLAPGLLLALANLLWIGVLLALLCLRFRDIPQLVTNIVQALFFLTPIIWQADILNRHYFLVEWNIINTLIDLIRMPLLGKTPFLYEWLTGVVLLIFGWTLTLVVFARYRSKISYWV